MNDWLCQKRSWTFYVYSNAKKAWHTAWPYFFAVVCNKQKKQKAMVAGSDELRHLRVHVLFPWPSEVRYAVKERTCLRNTLTGPLGVSGSGGLIVQLLQSKHASACPKKDSFISNSKPCVRAKIEYCCHTRKSCRKPVPVLYGDITTNTRRSYVTTHSCPVDGMCHCYIYVT